MTTPSSIQSFKKKLPKAINNNVFSTWPGFTARAVQKYLPDSAPSTDKEHTKIQRQLIRSTKDKIMTAIDKLETNRDLHLSITL